MGHARLFADPGHGQATEAVDPEGLIGRLDQILTADGFDAGAHSQGFLQC